MMGSLADLGLVNQVFLVCAVLGGGIFILKTLLMVLGGDADMGHDVDLSGDVHLDSDFGFQMLTIQGIIGFVMMFGLVGLFFNLGLGIGPILSTVAALAAGFATLWGSAKMMTWMKSLQSSGNIEEKNIIGQEGEVYLSIPEGGIGKVHVTVQNRLVEYDAEASDGKPIKTGDQIRVVFLKGNIVTVEKI